MKTLAESLRGNFVVANLGCIGDWDYGLPAELKAALTLIEIDAGGGAWTGGGYFKKIGVNQVIGGTAGPAKFRKNTFVGSCSLLKPKFELVKAFGIERYHTMEQELDVECTTMPEVLKQNGLAHVDFLKTDLEGVDFAVVKSCEPLLDQLLAVQCELRFEPFYQGEPPYHEVAAYLHAHGFELVGMFTEYWKYDTAHRFSQSHGKPIYADCLFFRRPEVIAQWPAEARALALAKQIVIAAMVGQKNHAEQLLETQRAQLPPEWLAPLGALVRPRFPTPKEMIAGFRKFFWPLELKLRYLVGSSRHVATK
ncbi:MAG: FkbM family methyltransferase [Verrucomicrobia bacterium]|nr:FkbM family methyltransferase [Verrucomicrobiota bacterium]